MDMTLDDIIKNKNIHRTGIGARIKNNKKKLQKSPQKVPRRTIVDARLKIIQKNRSKIRDARDKLAEITRASGDARKKLMRKQLSADNSQMKFKNKPIYRNRLHSLNLTSRSRIDKPMLTRTIPRNPMHMHMALAPRGYVDYDNIKDVEEEAWQLSRTVRNDLARYPSTSVRRTSMSDSREPFDPFDVYEVQPQARIERNPSNDYDMPMLPREVLRREVPNTRHYLPESSNRLSYEMRSRLVHSPDPHASRGIFANSRDSPEKSAVDTKGYRIVVSNLHSNVSQMDIKELFEDIGELYESRIVRPGVAEVVYKRLSDAETAVDTYHNRQLDGQPMKCLLVNPRTSYKSTSSSSLGKKQSKTPLEIDIDALHKVLFRRN